MSRLARARWRGGDRGFSTLEAVVVIPTVVLLTMLVVQYAMVWHARNIAQAAAQNGLQVARGYGATSTQGQASATLYLHDVAGRLLTDTQVSADRGASTVVVTVRATVASVVPFGSFHVSERAVGVTERFGGTGR